MPRDARDGSAVSAILRESGDYFWRTTQAHVYVYGGEIYAFDILFVRRSSACVM